MCVILCVCDFVEWLLLKILIIREEEISIGAAQQQRSFARSFHQVCADTRLRLFTRARMPLLLILIKTSSFSSLSGCIILISYLWSVVEQSLFISSSSFLFKLQLKEFRKLMKFRIIFCCLTTSNIIIKQLIHCCLI